MNFSVLCIDDDEFILETVSDYLKAEGCDVHCAGDEASAVKILGKTRPDIVLLDLMLQTTSGLDFLKSIREDYPNMPVIMISSRAEDIDKIIGLEAGADDYLAKPFHPRELSARIKSVMKRVLAASSQQDNEITTINFDYWQLSIKNYQVYDKEGVSAELTTKEFIVLKELIMNRDRVVSRDQLFKLFRDYSADIYDRVVDIQISRIRSKLGDSSKNPKYIKTIRDVGYTFVCEITD